MSETTEAQSAESADVRIGDLVRVKRRKRSVMIRVEKVGYDPVRMHHAPNGYIRVYGVRVRQSDLAMLSNQRSCELRRGYYFVPVEDVALVHRES